MAEVLIVLVILAILTAVAVPSVMAIQKNMEMTEIDSAARSIYVAAQNHMSNMRDSKYYVELEGAVPLSDAPSDFPVDGSVDYKTGEYLVLSMNSEGMQKLLPTGAIDQSLLKGTFYIEYNAKSGMVYGVFYATEPFTYSGALPREASERKKHDPPLGYYGGTSVDIEVMEELDEPEFEIINDADSLRVVFTALSSKYVYSLTITDGIKTAVYDSIFQSAQSNSNITSSMMDYTIILDKLVPGSHFSELFSDFTPGVNLEITLTVSDDGNSKDASTTKSTNSLFASRDGGGATVSNIRHLQNLHPDISKVTGVNQAAVGAPIDATGFEFTSLLNTELTVFNGNGNEITGLNAALFDSFDNGIVNRTYLVSPKIETTDKLKNVGTLVNTAVGMRITDCRVYAGDLKNYESATLASNGAENTGGLIGLAQNCTISSSFASLNLISASGGSTGGFAGRLEGSTVTKCFADTGYWDTSFTDGQWHRTDSRIDVGIIASTGISGGFAGVVSGGAINTSYSVGSLTMLASTGTAASFAGNTDGSVNYHDAYGAMRFTDCHERATLHGFTDAEIAAGNYCFYLKDKNVDSKANIATYSELAVCMAANKTTGTWRSGWCGGVDGTTVAYGLNGASLPFPVISGVSHYGDWEESAPKIYYYELYNNGTYSFHATIRGAEVSSLLDERAMGDSIWIVEDGYALLSDTHVAGEKLTIKYSARKPGDPWTLTYTEVLTSEEVKENNNPHNVIAFFMRPQEDNLGVLETATLSSVSASPYNVNYSSITADGTRYYFFPAFAKCAINGISANQPVGTEYEIRTPRQLSEMQRFMGRSYALTMHKTYKQMLDIDYNKYGISYKYTSTVGIFRGCTYDGGEHIITGIDIEPHSSGRGGFISSADTRAVIKNVRLISDLSGDSARKITGSEAAATGGLVGSLAGNATIENCVVSGFEISGGSYVGGLVGSSGNATITDSAAVNYSSDGCKGGYLSSSSQDAAIGVGGLVGTVNGALIVNNCYAITTVADESTATCNGLFGTIKTWVRAVFTDCYGFTMRGDEYYAAKPGAEPVMQSNTTKYYNVIQYDGENELDFDAFAAALSTPKQLSEIQPTVQDTHETCDVLSGEAYPYPSFVTDSGRPAHYGNWIHVHTVETGEEGLFYYEKYSDGTYGYYGTGMNTLSDTKIIEEDGYVAFFNYNNRGALKSVIYNGKDIKANQAEKQDVELNGKMYVIYYLSPHNYLGEITKHIDIPVDELLEVTVTKGGNTEPFTMYFNPHFAKTASHESTAPEYYEIRTARHLNQLSILTNNDASNYNWSDASFKQTRDIDFDTYSIKYNAVVPISGRSNALSGSFNGGGYKISNLRLSATAQYPTGMGVFGTISTSGNVSNVNLHNITVASSHVVSGILAGVNNGEITNSVVSNSAISATVDVVGGFVGTNNGKISDSRISATSVTKSNNNGSLGGFAGTNSTGATITNCFASELTISGITDVGGFVGKNSGTIEKSAAVSYTVDGSGGSITIGDGRSWAGSAGGFVSANSGTIENCYAVSTMIPKPAANQPPTAHAFVVSNSGTIKYYYAITFNASTGQFMTSSPGYYYNGTVQSQAEINEAFRTNDNWGIAGEYPFPAVVKDSRGNFVHYGKWPA